MTEEDTFKALQREPLKSVVNRWKSQDHTSREQDIKALIEYLNAHGYNWSEFLRAYYE